MLDHDEIKKKVMSDVRKTFNPEFLNRIDDIVVFKSLTREDIRQIVGLMIMEVNEQLSERDIELVISEAVESFLVEKGYDSEYGARPMQRAIQKYIEDELSELIILGEILDGSLVEATLTEDGEALHFQPLPKDHKVIKAEEQRVGIEK